MLYFIINTVKCATLIKYFTMYSCHKVNFRNKEQLFIYIQINIYKRQRSIILFCVEDKTKSFQKNV